MESDMTEQTPADEPIAPQEPSEAVVEVIAPPKKRGPAVGFFTPNAEVIEGEWGGMPAYRCSACPFDSLEVEKTRAHLSIHGQTYTQGA